MSTGDYIRRTDLYQRQLAETFDATRSVWGGTTTHSGNDYTITTTIPITRLLDGELFRLKPDAGNTGAATLTIKDSNGNTTVASKAIKRADATTALVSDELTSGLIHILQYDSSADVYRMIYKAQGATTHIGARVFNSAAITLTTATITYLTFDSERFDTDAIHSTSSNTGRITCNTPGKYLIWANVSYAFNATGRRFLGLRLNGTTLIGQIVHAPSTGSTELSISTVYDLAAADYIEVKTYQDSGGNLDIQAVGNYSPEFGMDRLG